MMTSVMVKLCSLFLLGLLLFPASALSQGSLLASGSHTLTPSISVSRSLGPNSGWLPGFNFAYGYFINDWIQIDGGIQLEYGFTENQIIAGSALGGVSFFYNRGSWVLPFGGFRLGIGALRENDSSGGAQNRVTVTLAPKVGTLFKVTPSIGIYVHVEYQRVFVLGDERQGYEDLNLIRIPVGVLFSF